MTVETWIALVVLTGLLVGLGVLELVRHRRNLARFRIRVHVNGTRGKSSVTRLIAAGLREGGVRTCAKTTGTLPRMILPDGRELPVYRPAGANIIEQIRIVSVATAYQAEALVIECMALQPGLQWLSEDKLLRATHGVITNARPDHLDVMGPGEEDVAWALAGMVPLAGQLFTAEHQHLPILAQVCRDRGAGLVGVEPADLDALSDAEMQAFRYREHRENVALALKVCADAGVDRATALRGMQKASPDPGAMTVERLEFFGRRIVFVNGFAANDPVSTGRIWQQSCAEHPHCERSIALVNCRADRPERSQQLARALAEWTPADRVVVVGSGTYIFARTAVAVGLDPASLVMADNLRAEEIFERVLALVPRSALVVGMGNIAGPGLELVRYFGNRSLIEGPAEAA